MGTRHLKNCWFKTENLAKKASECDEAEIQMNFMAAQEGFAPPKNKQTNKKKQKKPNKTKKTKKPKQTNKKKQPKK